MGLVYQPCSSEDLLLQQRSGWSGTKGRLRRENCESVKHDKLFSNWKILVGPSDWSEHAAGKDGIDRYHLHNLPADRFGPGVYELGVTAPSWSPTLPRQPKRTLTKEDVIAVYVGQADNVRLRLQKYGQAGSHLEGFRSFSTKLYQGDDESVSEGSSNIPGSTNSGSNKLCNGLNLFTEVFALGSSIAFRWAQTDSKAVAKQVESELLAVFDYAWNKSGNGNRRSRDILAKLFMAWPTNDSLCKPLLAGKNYLLCGTNAVGIKVALRKPQDLSPTTSNNSGFYPKTLPQVPVVVNVRNSVNVASLELRCGVVTDRGTPCNTPPVKGRKRCLQHKGMRVIRTPATSNVPLLQATKESNVRPESVKVGGGSTCLPRSLFGLRQSKSVFVHTTESKPGMEALGERRRPPSLSFDTWMRMENERVHDSRKPPYSNNTENEKVYSAILLHKHVSAIPRHRVRQIGTNFTPMPVDNTKRR